MLIRLTPRVAVGSQCHGWMGVIGKFKDDLISLMGEIHTLNWPMQGCWAWSVGRDMMFTQLLISKL